MESIIWDKKFSVGNQEVDDQHKMLFEILSRCLSIKDRSMSKYLVLVRDLLDYCQIHFSLEEKLMAENDYPGLDAHILEHKKITAAVEKIIVKLYRGEDVDIEAINNFVHSWVIKHILETDMAFKDYVS